MDWGWVGGNAHTNVGIGAGEKGAGKLQPGRALWDTASGELSLSHQ